MKKTILFFIFCSLTAGLFAQKDKAAPIELKTGLDSVSYAYGMNYANNLKKAMDKDLNLGLFLAGLNAQINGADTKISNEEAGRRFNEYATKVAEPRITARWKDDNAKFLEENKKKPGVITTASGLQYEVLTKGTGTTSPKASDMVEVHYHGTLIDGRVFDSSVNRKKTATFALNRVISGWTEGLQYMKVGDKFRFYIPYNLAYGESDRPNSVIKGYSTLIFDVELFNIQSSSASSSSAPASSANDKAAGVAFLAENKKKPGITTTASGLQYEVLKHGTGKVSPKATDVVEVHYHGTLIDGKVFDSSVQRGETIKFGLNQVIKGWTEGLQLMKEGDKFKFYIPSELAYGDNSPGAGIPPGAVLIFEVELFKVNP